MGRTQRTRSRKKSSQFVQNMDHEETLINLRKFLARNGCNDEVNLKLRNFPQTGRGLATTKNLHENDILIKVPYDLMITYATLKRLNFLQIFTPSSKLTIQDLLTTFLIFERHKNDSFWRDYITSLPSHPPWLPALLSEHHCELLPVDLRLAAKKSRRLLEESWSRVKGSIKQGWTCSCCGMKVDRVFDLHSFTWGFILVNTRAVYVDPGVVGEGGGGVLSDEPCMALCPFLDMFNHSDKAKCSAELKYEEGKLFYQLTTLTSYKKYEQVFISYGGHDNVKLLMEYGFFIPGNCNDCISIQSEEVFRVLRLGLGEGQYRFINRHDLNKELFVGESGPSFNLKGFLFVASSSASEVKDFASVVYTDSYPEEFLKSEMKDMCRKLLLCEMAKVEESLRGLKVLKVNSVIIDFLNCRHDFIKKLCEML
ncbi:hypothetical protein Zmor_015665 [Zophobas morio]|uniref:SET domain-containing protein n=1 Tax=Zophobas morio TaxID=2755281 RepID=A0AA38IH26_9CUCU|nr:hypothetical protein Zmor_015665 [Zophobas morio]